MHFFFNLCWLMIFFSYKISPKKSRSKIIFKSNKAISNHISSFCYCFCINFISKSGFFLSSPSHVFNCIWWLLWYLFLLNFCCGSSKENKLTIIFFRTIQTNVSFIKCFALQNSKTKTYRNDCKPYENKCFDGNFCIYYQIWILRLFTNIYILGHTVHTTEIVVKLKNLFNVFFNLLFLFCFKI